MAEIGRQITADYEGQSTGHPLVLIGVLKGAAIFLSDLARAISIDNTFDFVAVSSYGRARVSSGAVKLIKDIDNPIEGRHVILVEDILDTGLTLSYLRGLMLQHKPASLKIATCLDKPSRRLVPIEADYVGFKIPNQFVIGYGMDYCGGLPQRARYPDLSQRRGTLSQLRHGSGRGQEGRLTDRPLSGVAGWRRR